MGDTIQLYIEDIVTRERFECCDLTADTMLYEVASLFFEERGWVIPNRKLDGQLLIRVVDEENPNRRRYLRSDQSIQDSGLTDGSIVIISHPDLHEQDICLVLSPFVQDSSKMNSLNHVLIALERIGLQVEVAEDEISSDLLPSVVRAKLVVADLTGHNSPVVYSLGMCEALNKEVIVLAQDRNDVPFSLQNGRQIIFYKDTSDGYQKLQEDLTMVIQDTRASLILAIQLKQWYRACKRELEQDIHRRNQYFELVIKTPAGRNRHNRVLIWTFDAQILPEHIQEMQQAVTDNNFDDGWLVSTIGVSEEAYDEAEKLNILACMYYELIDEIIDWTPYFNQLKSQTESLNIDEYYVELSGNVEEYDYTWKKTGHRKVDHIDEYVNEWLESSTKDHFSILGEFGTGKTWLMLHYAYHLIEQYEKAIPKKGKRPRIPIFIKLHDYQSKGVIRNVFTLLSDFIFNDYQLNINLEQFKQLCQMGRILFIFDGFDEMAMKVDARKINENFRQLAGVVLPGAKSILTCRTEHFLDAKEHVGAEKHFLETRHQLSMELQANISAFEKSSKLEVLYLETLSPTQLHAVLERRDDPEFATAIMNHPHLSELATRPLLIDLILEASEEVGLENLSNMVDIYFHAVQRKMKRDIDSEITFTRLCEKEFFLCELAWEMFVTGIDNLHYGKFPDRVLEYFRSKIALEGGEDPFERDMLGKTLLIRDAKGNYSFAHQSLLEFFIAYKLTTEIGVLPPPPPAGDAYSADKDPKDETAYQTIQDSFANFRQFRLQSIVDENTIVKEPLLNFKQFFLPHNTLKMMVPMTGNKEVFWEILNWTRDKKEEEVCYAGGNAMTALHLGKEDFVDKDFSRMNLSGSNLYRADLTGASFYEASLREAHLNGCNLQDADFRKADLTNLNIEEMNAVYALSWCPDNQHFISGGVDRLVRIWNGQADHWHQERVMFAQPSHTLSLQWSPCSRFIVAGTAGDGVVVWEYDKLPSLKNQHIGDPRRYKIEQGIIRGIDILGESEISQLIAIGTEEGCKILDANDGSEITMLKVHDVFDAVFSPDGNSIAVAPFDEKNRILVYDIENNYEEYELCGHCSNVVQLRFTHEGQYLVSCTSRTGNNENVVVWDMTNKKKCQELKNSDKVQAIEFSPDGKYLIGGFIDGNMGVFDIEHDECIDLFEAHNKTIRTIRYSPNGKYFVTAGDEGIIRIWEGSLQNGKLGKCLEELDVRINCDGVNLIEARGLDKIMLQFFSDRHAKLDENQSNLIAAHKGEDS